MSGEKQHCKISCELQRCVCRKALCHVFRWVEIIFGKDLCQAVTVFILGQWDLGVVSTL